MYNWNIIPAFTADFILLVLIIYSFFDRKAAISPHDKRFSVCLYSSFISTNINAFSVYCITKADIIPLWINYIVQLMDFLMGGFCSMLIFQYLIYKLFEHSNEKNTEKLSLFLLVSVTCVYFVAVLINPFTNWIFYFDGLTYMRGPYNQMIFFFYIIHVLLMMTGFLM